MALLLEIHEGCIHWGSVAPRTHPPAFAAAAARVFSNVRDWLSHDWSWIQLLWRRDNLNLKLKYPKLN